MTSCAGSPATNDAQRLINGAMREVNFLCCFNNHVESLQNKKEQLAAIRIKVLKDIEDAKERDETRVDDDVQRFLNETDVMIEEDTKTRKKWFHGWFSDCIWQYRQGKKLAKKMQDIEDLKGRSYEFQRVAYRAKIPSFIDFESRKSTLEELVQALEHGNCGMIGLQGLGGMGKTTLALQVGVHVEESKAFQKVIFTTVSNSPCINKIQADIARQLGLSLEKIGEEAEHSRVLWSRIANNEGKVLIILDDIWEELDLRDIGIPHNHKNCCVLITTCDSTVCEEMGCQLTIHLQTLTDPDALNLFVTHANDDDLSSSDLNGVALDIVNECGGLPIAIVAIARTLRNRPVGEWKFVLTALQNSQAWVDVDEDLTKVYECLKLSYYNLRNEKAKKLFLLCSLFPKDYEIPISLLISLSIGAGIFDGQVDKYCEARSQALAEKNELINSSLLMKVEKGCVKMHDLVRKVAWWIAKEDTQVITNSKVKLKSNLRFLFWSGDDFPNQFHGTELEVLLLRIKGYVKLQDAKDIFKEMGSLRVLVLRCDVQGRLTLPLQSLLLLKNIRTLVLNGWKLPNISILENMQSLETLELTHCSIPELPKEIKELKKLKLLGLRGCSIKRNNPFEVIARCSQLEELYFVENDNVYDWKRESNRENIDKVSQDIPPLALQMYSIACFGLRHFGDDNGLLKYFDTKHMKNLISGALFQYLLEKAEVLELGGKSETRWRSLVPDIVPFKDGAINGLTKLCLYEGYDIEYLIDARELLHSDVRVFSKLVELHMIDADVQELCRGPPIPSRFLEQLQILKLSGCKKLHNIFLDGNLKLPHLKILELKRCPMVGPSIFKPSVARSLVQLEELVIERCDKLRSLIADESLGEEMVDVDDQNSYDPVFPRLKTLKIVGCEKLEVVSPLLLAEDFPLLQDLSIKDCGQLRYVFDEYRHEGKFLHQYTVLPSLTMMDLDELSSLINIFQKCKTCMQRPPPIVSDNSKETRVSKSKMQQHTISPLTDGCLLTPPWGFQNIRQMKLWGFPNIRSLFRVSIAAIIKLEKLEISKCKQLKHIITNEGEDYDHINYSSIFPELQVLDISYCDKLEFIFPSTVSGGLQKLKYLTIDRANKLKYVFGKYNQEDYSSNDNGNDEFHIDLPAFEILSLKNVPSMISICINKKHPSLQILDAAKATKMHMQNVTSQQRAKKSKIEEINVEKPGSKYGLNCHILQQITIAGNEKLETIFSTSTWKSLPQLSKLCIRGCDSLRNVVKDDSKDPIGHINYSSIFPKLEDLEIRRCMSLEFIFPSPVSGGLPKLKRLVVTGAAKLKYIFGKYYENESDEVQVDLSALETLSLTQVPNMINICATKHNILKLSSLRNIALDNYQELSARPSPNLTLYWKPAKDLIRVIMDGQKLTSLAIEESIIEEVFKFGVYVNDKRFVDLNLEIMSLKHLRELRCICRDGKYSLSLHNLSKLEIESCRKLRVVFSAPMTKSLRQLSDLRIKDCPELLHLIEEDDEESADDHLHQLYFPKLQDIYIQRCHSLKCLFSISTFGMLPKLQSLQIGDASELEQVFTLRKQDDIQKMAVKDVFPTLSKLILNGLPRLVTVCGRINFQTVEFYRVDGCPRYKGRPDWYSKYKAATMGMTYAQRMRYMGETSSSTNFAEGVIESMEGDRESEKEVGKVVPALKLTTSPKVSGMKEIVELDFQENDGSEEAFITRKQSGVPSLKPRNEISQVAVMEKTLEQGFQGHETSRDAIHSIDSESRKQPTVPSDITEVGQGNKETIKQGLQENYALEEAKRVIESASSDLTKQSTEPFLKLSEKDLAQSTKEVSKKTVEELTATETPPMSTQFELEFIKRSLTIKETKDESVEKRPVSIKATKVNLSDDVISSTHHQSQIGSASTSSPILEIGEILELVELKDEQALLVKSLERYPQLRLSRGSRPIIAFAYRVLVDILIMLSTKTPYTITEVDKSTLEENLGAATFLGFDKDWVESVRAKVFDIDMVDVLATREKILDMKTKLEEHDTALEHMRKERAEAEERLAMARRQLEIAQSEFRAIDSHQL